MFNKAGILFFIWAPRLASLAVGLSAYSPRQAHKARMPPGYPLQSLARHNSYFNSNLFSMTKQKKEYL